MIKLQIRELTISLVCVLAMTGCGGSSSDEASADSSSNNVGKQSSADNISSTNSINSNGSTPFPYAKSSPEHQVFQYLNSELNRCGFGQLTQNAKIDQAAKNHVEYMFTNGILDHQESAASTGFTGEFVGQRLNHVGYDFRGRGEVLAGKKSSSSDKVSNSAIELLRNLFIAPYHMTTLTVGFKNVGINFKAGKFGDSQAGILVVDFGIAKDADLNQIGNTQVLTYPCQGSSNVKPKLIDEQPNPIPGRNLKANPIGSSVYVRVHADNTLQITSKSVKDLSTGKLVPLLPTLTQSTDKNKKIKAYEVVIMPNEPLSANTNHQVNISGTNNGVAFTKSFTFKTGS